MDASDPRPARPVPRPWQRLPDLALALLELAGAESLRALASRFATSNTP
jgi:hypothetical protein